MKFYVISFLINVALLFIPIAISDKILDGNEKQSISINLETSSLGYGEETLNSGDTGNSGGSGESVMQSQNQEQQEQIEQKNINQNALKTSNMTANKLPNVQPIKPVVSDSKIVTNKNSGTNLGGISNNSGNGTSSGNSTGSHSGNNSSGGNSQDGDGNSKGSGNKNGNQSGGGGGNVCREGIDFVVTYNPDLPYPTVAQRLGINEVVRVNVRLTVNGNGTVNVISVSGGHQAFYNDAKSAAKRIKINIKNPEVVKCTLTKPFRFNPK